MLPGVRFGRVRLDLGRASVCATDNVCHLLRWNSLTSNIGYLIIICMVLVLCSSHHEVITVTCLLRHRLAVRVRRWLLQAYSTLEFSRFEEVIVRWRGVASFLQLFHALFLFIDRDKAFHVVRLILSGNLEVLILDLGIRIGDRIQSGCRKSTFDLSVMCRVCILVSLRLLDLVGGQLRRLLIHLVII